MRISSDTVNQETKTLTFWHQERNTDQREKLAGRKRIKSRKVGMSKKGQSDRCRCRKHCRKASSEERIRAAGGRKSQGLENRQVRWIRTLFVAGYEQTEVKREREKLRMID